MAEKDLGDQLKTEEGATAGMVKNEGDDKDKEDDLVEKFQKLSTATPLSELPSSQAEQLLKCLPDLQQAIQGVQRLQQEKDEKDETIVALQQELEKAKKLNSDLQQAKQEIEQLKQENDKIKKEVLEKAQKEHPNSGAPGGQAETLIFEQALQEAQNEGLLRWLTGIHGSQNVFIDKLKLNTKAKHKFSVLGNQVTPTKDIKKKTGNQRQQQNAYPRKVAIEKAVEVYIWDLSSNFKQYLKDGTWPYLTTYREMEKDPLPRNDDL